jgi:predicted hydrolase (HD superfamily)
MSGFEEIVSTAPEQDALDRLRAATGVSDGIMERHCLRVRHIAARLAADRHWVIDGEVLTVAAILHDIGLYPPYASRDEAYVADGAVLAREILPEHGWAPERVKRCADAIERHHELRAQIGRGPEVEAIRLADRCDVSGGIQRAGVSRAWLRGLVRAIPRRGLYRELVRLLAPELRRRPATLPRIFWR